MQNEWVQPIETAIKAKSLKLKSSYSNSVSCKIFNLFSNEEFFNLVTQETNKYDIQRCVFTFTFAANSGNKKRRQSFKKLSAVSMDEIKKYFGIMPFMRVHKLPNCRMYWGAFTNVPVLFEMMTRNCFDEILSFLHFNDND